MVILLTLLYLSFRSSIALPTSSDIPIDIPPSLLSRSGDKFGNRSLWNIIWSCLSTLFACTWFAVHPNIPAPNDSKRVVIGRRVAIMGCVLIAPEMVILWAARQHYGAKHFAKQHQKRGWTMTHGFFVIMGGFTLHDEQGTPLRILEPIELEKLSEAGRIEWPSVTEDEIQDRSKGDYLSKGIVLVQTSWFIIQCLARFVYRLEVTELEVATLAFAVLTGFTYYLWWNKPLDVRCSIPVYLLKNDETGRADSQSTSLPSGTENPVSTSPPISHEPVQNLNSIKIDSQSAIIEENRIPQQILVVASDPEPNPQSSSLSNSSCHYITTTPMLGFPPYLYIQRDFSTLPPLRHALPHLIAAFAFPFLNMAESDTLHNSMPLRTPTFYSPVLTDCNPNNFSSSIALCAAVIVGGIHCVAWLFHFPSHLEQVVWRMSAAGVVGVPIPVFVFLKLRFEGWENKVLRTVGRELFFYGLSSFYITCRICLLVLPCITLRALHQTALVDIKWTAFSPHIG